MDTRHRLFYRLLMLAGFGTLAAFAGWWLQPSHVPGNFRGPAHAVDYALFLALTLVVFHRIFMDTLSWVVARKITPPEPKGTPPVGARVAFITTFVPAAEPIDLLLSTLPAMIAADYEHDTWVLDEGDDDDVKRLCAQLGVHYFSRAPLAHYNTDEGKFARRTKGGNHNAWYDAHGHAYDFVAQIDTDFVPRHDFLTKTLARFDHDRVAFVGTPQVYGNEDQSLIAKGAAQQLYTFYGPFARGMSGRGINTMIGANHVVRVSALREIDFYAGHLTEDLITGMLLHSAGWESRYVPEQLAVGEGPATWQAYFNQQMRWAFGCMDIMRRQSAEITRKMSWSRATIYVSLQQHYYTGVAMAMGMLLLVLYFFTGVHSADMSLLSIAIWYAPLLLVRQAISLWLQRFNTGPQERGMLWAGRFISTVVWPVYFLAAVGVMRGKRLTFRVTPKGDQQDLNRTPLLVAAPQIVVMAISASCLAAGFTFHRTSLPLMFWAAANLALMGALVAHVVHGNLRQTVFGRHSLVTLTRPAESLSGLITADEVSAA